MKLGLTVALWLVGIIAVYALALYLGNRRRG